MGAKSRGGWNINICLKKCLNREKRVQGTDDYTYCDLCVKFSLFKPKKVKIER